MLNILERIDAELNQAIRNKDSLVVLVLRSVKSGVHNQEIKLRTQDQALTEEDIIKILHSEVKKRQEAATLYSQGGRDELAAKEKQELTILEKFLPSAPSSDEVRAAALVLKQDLGLNSVADMGKLTKALLAKFGSGLSGQTASAVAKEILAS